MSKKNVNKNVNKKFDTQRSSSSWDMAITDAEQKIKKAKAYIRRLKTSILVFKESRDCGEPFPGEITTQNNQSCQ